MENKLNDPKLKEELQDAINLSEILHTTLMHISTAFDDESEEQEPDVTRLTYNSGLDTNKTFDNFIEGISNKQPRITGLSIAEQQDEVTYNPFFIYGPSGCGKSHLANAIGVCCREKNPKMKVVYVTARQFQYQFTDSLTQDTTFDFRNFYQSVDLLIVDNIQEWMNAPKTLSAFFYVFNHLLRNGKQIIITSDRPPVNLKGMDERILKHLASGLIVELEKPDMQLCIDILNDKCRQYDLNISADIVEFIAKSINGCMYDLESVMNSLKVYFDVNKTNIDINIVKRVIMRSVKLDNK